MMVLPVQAPPGGKKKKGKKQPTSETDEEAETLSFAVFALRDLKANEEVVLGWEWDDQSVIHQLPALIESPHLFAYASSLYPSIFVVLNFWQPSTTSAVSPS